MHRISGRGGEGETEWNAARRRGGGLKKSALSKTRSQRSLKNDKLNKQVIKSLPRTSEKKKEKAPLPVVNGKYRGGQTKRPR